MVLMQRITTLLLVSATLLSGCANKGVLPPQDRASLRGVRVVTPPPVTTAVLYSDRSSATAMVAGAPLGVAGALVGGAVAAGIMEAGRTKFRPATEAVRGSVPGIVADEFRKTLDRAGKTAAAHDATVSVKDLKFGVGHLNDQRFLANIQATVSVTRQNGSLAATRLVGGVSETSFTKHEAISNPAVLQAALREAAADLAGTAVTGLWDYSVLQDFRPRNVLEQRKREDREIELREEQEDAAEEAREAEEDRQREEARKARRRAS